MDLTYTDRGWDELGLLPFSSADFADGPGGDSADFDVTLSDGAPIPEEGSVLYDESGEVGGIVRGVTVDGDEVHVTGVTWWGLLGEHVMRPPSGSAYLTLSGTIAQVAERLIGELGLSGAVAVSGGPSGSVTHTFAGNRTDETQQDSGRYMDGRAAMWQLLVGCGCKASMAFDADARRVSLSVSEATDWTDQEALASHVASLRLSKARAVNHLVCLGQGEGAARTVVDLYADSAGRVSGTQTLTGTDEVAQVYDDTGAEDEAALRSQGTARLAELVSGAKSVKAQGSVGAGWDVGDIVGGTDARTGVKATAVVVRKVVTVAGRSSPSVTYETTVRV